MAVATCYHTVGIKRVITRLVRKGQGCKSSPKSKYITPLIEEKGSGLNFDVITGHLGLLNFAVASILSLQALKVETRGSGAGSKLSLLLFSIATFSVFASICWQLIDGRFDLFESRAMVLALGVSALALGAHFFLRMTSINAFVSPVATLLMLAHFFQSPFRSGEEFPELSSVFLSFHIAGALMGQVVAVCAAIVSVLFLWQQRVLKRKLLNQLTARVPALDLLEKVLITCMWAGFLFLTAALLSGAFYVQWHGAPKGAYYEKVVWAITVWIWYLSALLARNVVRVPVKRVAQMGLFGFLLLATTFFGMTFF